MRKCFYFLLTPKSREKDSFRKEFILNVLLVGSIFLSFSAFISAFIGKYFFSINKDYSGIPPFILFLLLTIFFVLYIASKTGRSRLTAYTLLFLYFCGATYTAYFWGVDVPQAILIYALIIVMSGILVDARFAFFMSAIISVTLLSIGYLQQEKMIAVSTFWKSKPADFRDSFVTIVTLFIIAIVSWLSNRETEKALNRARISEKALKQERDLLELKVEERTRELQQAQVEKMTQLYRFAEVGRLTAGFFHDLATPLAIISLNLSKLNRESNPKELTHLKVLLKRAMTGTKYLENFVLAARKQLQNQDIKRSFSLNYEIKQVIKILSYKTTKRKIKIIFHATQSVRIFGNPIKFNQIITNLLVNAIDAYDHIDIDSDKKIITINLSLSEKTIILSVHDWGTGIKKENLEKVFDAFFTTKLSANGTGLGLAITRELVKKHFSGKITVKSNHSNGTIFTTTFPKITPTLKQSYAKN